VLCLYLLPFTVSRCTVQPWPEDALERVAYKFLEDVDMQPDEKKSTVNLCKYFHTSAAQLSSR